MLNRQSLDGILDDAHLVSNVRAFDNDKWSDTGRFAVGCASQVRKFFPCTFMPALNSRPRGRWFDTMQFRRPIEPCRTRASANAGRGLRRRLAIPALAAYITLPPPDFTQPPHSAAKDASKPAGNIPPSPLVPQLQ